MIKSINITYTKENVLQADILNSFLDFIGYYSEKKEDLDENKMKSNQEETEFLKTIEEQLKTYQQNHVGTSETTERVLSFLTDALTNISSIEPQSIEEFNMMYRIKRIDKNKSLNRIIDEVLTDFLQECQSEIFNNFKDSQEILNYLKNLFLEYNIFSSTELLNYGDQTLVEEARMNFINVQKQIFTKIETEKNQDQNTLQRLKCALMYCRSIRNMENGRIIIVDSQKYFALDSSEREDLYDLRYAKILESNGLTREIALAKYQEMLYQNFSIPSLNSDICFRVANIYTHYKERYPEAFQFFQKAISINPTLENNWFMGKFCIIKALEEYRSSKINKRRYQEIKKQGIEYIEKAIEIGKKNGLNNLTLYESKIYLQAIHTLINQNETLKNYAKVFFYGNEFIEYLIQANNKYLNYFELNSPEIKFQYFFLPKIQKLIFELIAISFRAIEDISISEKIFELANQSSEKINTEDLSEIHKLVREKKETYSEENHA